MRRTWWPEGVEKLEADALAEVPEVGITMSNAFTKAGLRHPLSHTYNSLPTMVVCTIPTDMFTRQIRHPTDPDILKTLRVVNLLRVAIHY